MQCDHTALDTADEMMMRSCFPGVLTEKIFLYGSLSEIIQLCVGIYLWLNE